jgi:hypothetical protein
MEFAVLLHGTQVHQEEPESGQIRIGGVFCWKVVDAEDEFSAIEAAISFVVEDSSFQEEVKNPSGTVPIFEVEEVYSLSPDQSPNEIETSYVFYIDDPETVP